jgi:RNA polymerase sigma factor (sigma-70 family)
MLCSAYWRPIYKYVRLRWQKDAADAQDLTQGFFFELLERDLLRRFDAGKSRLRSYMRLCVDSFVINQEKAATRQKRGGNIQHVVLDVSGAEEELSGATIDHAAIASPESLEEFFEKEWVRSLFGLAVDELSLHCAKEDREKAFRAFDAYHLCGDDEISYTQLAERFGVPVTTVNNWLSWTRREFRRIVLERLREVCGSEEDFEREAKGLFGGPIA